MAQPFQLPPLFEALLGIAIALAAGTGHSQTSRPETSARPAAPAAAAGRVQTAPDSATSDPPGSTSSPQGKRDVETSGRIPDQETSFAEDERGPAADAELQTQIQNTLNKDPTLSGHSLRAKVTQQHIELSGSVTTSREKLTAARIALSYAGNKKLVNGIVMTGSASSPRPAAASSENVTGPSTGNSAPGRGSGTPATKSQSYQGARPPQP